MIDIGKPGKYTVQLGIESVESVHEKVLALTVVGDIRDEDGAVHRDTLPFKVKVWKSMLDKFAVKPEADKTAEATVEVKAKEGYGNECWLESFGGATQQQGFKGGGGGGRQFVPKSQLDIHASCIAGIIKSAVEHAPSPQEMDAMAVAAIKVYKAATKDYPA